MAGLRSSARFKVLIRKASSALKRMQPLYYVPSNQRLLLTGPAASTFELVAAVGAAAPRSRSAIR